MKKISLILVILVITFLLFWLTKILNDISNNKMIEPYCAAKYSSSVSEYKNCKELNVNLLLDKLTKEAQENNKLEEVPEIKL